jgi:hypothetical protein
MPGNLQTENIVSDPPPTIVVSLTTTAPHFLSLSPDRVCLSVSEELVSEHLLLEAGS